MARLFTCGFEENEFTLTTWTTATGSPTIVTTGTPHSGTYHLKSVAGVGNPVGPKRDLSAANSNTIYTRSYWKPDVLPTSGTTTSILTWRDSSNAASWQLVHVRATGKLRINNSKNANATADTANAVSQGVYYRLEIEHVISATVGSITLNVYTGDSNTLLDTAALTSQNTGTDVLTFLMNSSAGENQGHTWYHDDIAINDSTQSFQNSWCGPGKIFLLKPNGDSQAQWTKAGSAPAGTNFGGVAEVPGTPDDGTTYNEDSGTTNRDILDLTDCPSEVPTSGAYNMVLAHANARVQAGAASQTMKIGIKDDLGNTSSSASISLVNGTWNFTSTAQGVIANIGGKTIANLNAFQGTYIGNTGVSAKRITSYWMNVEWIDAIHASTSATLGGLTRSISGQVLVVGSLIKTLAAATISAAGTVTAGGAGIGAQIAKLVRYYWHRHHG